MKISILEQNRRLRRLAAVAGLTCGLMIVFSGVIVMPVQGQVAMKRLAKTGDAIDSEVFYQAYALDDGPAANWEYDIGFGFDPDLEHDDQTQFDIPNRTRDQGQAHARIFSHKFLTNIDLAEGATAFSASDKSEVDGAMIISRINPPHAPAGVAFAGTTAKGLSESDYELEFIQEETEVVLVKASLTMNCTADDALVTGTFERRIDDSFIIATYTGDSWLIVGSVQKLDAAGKQTVFPFVYFVSGSSFDLKDSVIGQVASEVEILLNDGLNVDVSQSSEYEMPVVARETGPTEATGFVEFKNAIKITADYVGAAPGGGGIFD